uniref:V-SNARE coiled-coil homology domain-containing protein n=1 Tax=Oryza barthii TaxID=65489 RepID=A0A0D3FQ09_9ORYZ
MGVDLAVSGLLDKMVKLTMVARVTDGLPLAEGLDDGRDQKDADFYKQQAKLLFKNLSKGQHEASRMSIETGPYFFQTQRNLAKLNDELYEVHQIMTRNVQEVLGVGEKLDQVTEMSTRLTSDTRMYADKAKDLNRQALIRKYAPVAIVIGVVLMLFWLKNKIW